MIIWPEYISLKDWAADLIGTYSKEFLPILEDEDKWQEWGAIVAGTGIFAKAGVPTPFSLVQGKKQADFESWQEWAKIIYINVNYQIEPKKNIIT